MFLRSFAVFSFMAVIFSASAAQIYVVNGNADAAEPYDSKDNAAASIQAAINYAAAGDEIIIAASGDAYGSFTVNKGVTVRGESGNFHDVLVVGTDSAANTVTISSSAAVLSSITVKGGLRCIYNSGGGIVTNCYATGGNPAVKQNGSGHGIYNNNGKVLDSVIDGCRSSDHFAGIGYYQTGANALGDRLTITNNYANQTFGNWSDENSNFGAHGAAIMGGILRNSIIARNLPKAMNHMSGWYISTGVYAKNARVINCTIYGNTSPTTTTRAFAALTGTGGRFENCIIDNNLCGTAVANWGFTSADFINCATAPVAGLGVGNINIADAGWSFSSSERVLNAEDGSTLIDAGLNSSTVEDVGLVDYYGNPRTVNSIVDIGHEECQPGIISARYISTEGFVGFAPFSTTLKAFTSGKTEGVVYYWDLDGDESADIYGSDKSVIDYVFNESKDVSVTLYVTNSVGNSAKMMQIFSIKTMLQYVDSASSNPQPPYATPETAATTLQAAIDTAVEGGTIIIRKGSVLKYTVPININKKLTIVGETGDFNDCIIDTSGAHRILNILHPEVVLSSVTVRNGNYNNDSQCGAGITIHDGGTVTNCRITACIGYGAGTGVYNNNGHIVDCVIDNIKMHDTSNGNSQNYNYKGLGIWQSGVNAITERCIITNCYSPVLFAWANNHAGGAVYLTGGTIRNCYIANNFAGKMVGNTASARLTTGLYASGSSIVDNCTILNNTTEGSTRNLAYGLNLVGAAIARNCIVLENGDGFAETNNWIGAVGAFTNMLSTSVEEIAGGVEANARSYIIDPISKIAVCPVESGAIGAGAVLDWMANDIDLFGNGRISGSLPDIGCVESDKLGVYCSFSADKMKGLDAFTSTFTPNVAGEGVTASLTYCWDFGDGSEVVSRTTSDPVEHTFAYPDTDYGEKIVTLTVRDSQGDAVASFSDLITLAPTRVYAANGNSNAKYPYSTPETAAPNIQTAINAAYDGSEVIVLPSSSYYNVSSATLVIKRNIILSGSTGNYKDVVIDANNKRRVMLITAKNALVRNVTISRGNGSNNTHSPRGASIKMTGSEIRNCRITGASGNDGLLAQGIWCENGRVIGCVFDNNKNGNGHCVGLGIHALGRSAFIDRCVFTNNNSTTGFYHWDQYRIAVVAIYEGTIRNSLIAHNTYGTASACGTGVGAIGLYGSAATIENTVVVSNRWKSGEYVNIRGGVALENACTVINSIIDENYAPAGLSNHIVLNNSKVNYSATNPYEGIGENNMLSSAGDYAFVPGGKFLLPLSSPLIGAGLNLPWMETALDLYGGKRRVRLNVDIGCFENQTRPATFLLMR